MATATPLIRHRIAEFPDIHSGIDVRYRANAGDLEFDFILPAGINPATIQLVAEGEARFSLEGNSGEVIVTRGRDEFRLRKPRAFQPTATGSVEIPVEAIVEPGTMRFHVPKFDPSLPIVIDPLVATWSTFIGTETDAFYDDATAVATDSAGNLYVAGLTQFDQAVVSGDMIPTTPGSLRVPQPFGLTGYTRCHCGYVIKLSPTHQVLYGALLPDYTIKALAVDAAGNVYITGENSSGTFFPATAGTFSNNPIGQAFVAKISAGGDRLVYSALFVGKMGNAISVDAQGDAYVVGKVDYPGLPTTPGAIKPTYMLGATTNEDGFLLKVSADGTSLLYGTYLGGSGADVASAIKLSTLGEIVIAGQTASSDFVGMPAIPRGTSDAFLIRISPDGSRILDARTFGGDAADSVSALAPDGAGGWLLCGATTSANFPTSSTAFQKTLLGERNGWVRRVSGDFQPVYSTYFGGSFIDGCINITSDGSAKAYLVGVTFSADLPTTVGAFQEDTSALPNSYFGGLGGKVYLSARDPDREAYFAQISSDGSELLYGTLLGGFGTVPMSYPPFSFGSGISNSPSGTIYVSGSTVAASFPVTDGGLRQSMGGNADGFIAAFAPSDLRITTPSALPSAPLSVPYRVILSAAGGTGPYTWSAVGFHLPQGLSLSADGVLSGSAGDANAVGAGNQFTVKVKDAAGNAAYKSLLLKVDYPGNPICGGNTCLLSLHQGSNFVFELPTLARGVPPLSFAVTGGVPPGLKIDSTGTITSERLTETGQFNFAVSLSDSTGRSEVVNWSVLVSGGDALPNASISVSPASAVRGQVVTVTWRSVWTSGCEATGGGADGASWSGVLPIFGTRTFTASTAGEFSYGVRCASSSTETVAAQASIRVSEPSGTGSSATGGGAGGSSASDGSGGGGSLPLSTLALLLVAAGQRGLRQGVHGRMASVKRLTP